MSIAGAQLKGAGRIFAIGTRPNCAELAKKYGATDIISYKDGDTVEQILSANDGQVDRAIITVPDVSCMRFRSSSRPDSSSTPTGARGSSRYVQ